MKPTKLAPTFLVIPFALATLACPTRPIDKDAGADMDTGGGGHGAADAGVAGADGAAGSGAAGAGGAVGGHAGAAAGSGGGTAGSGFAGAAGGAAGTSGVRDGQPCSIASDCASGLCKGFYLDVDGDGYGAGPPVGFCGTTAPVGYASMNGDCCDNATNIAVAKLIHPGADFQTTSAGGVCGITWDYDCGGTVESNPQTYACAGTYPACPSIAANWAESSCGTPDDKGCNCSGMSGSCMIFCVGHPAGETIACK